MPNIKLIAFDLDGTLLDPKRQLTQVHIDAVRRARDAGYIITLASGRNVASIEAFAKELDIQGPMVCSNGAHVLANSQTEIVHHSIPTSTADTLTRYALDNDLHVSIYARYDVHFVHRNRWSEIYEERVRHIVPIMREEPNTLGLEVTKILFADEPEVLEPHQEAIEQMSGLEMTIVRTEPDYLEFLPTNINKGLGLNHVANHFRLKPEEIAAIGDYYNDLEMLRYAGFSCAMGTAPADVQAAANLVAPSNVEGGVAWFIDALMSNERK